MWITFVDKCVSLVKMDEKRDRHANDTGRTNGTENVHKSCENVDTLWKGMHRWTKHKIAIF